MEANDLTPEDVADELGVDVDDVEAWMSGDDTPDVDSAGALEDWLLIPVHCWVDDLEDGDDE